jgi:DNA invertase Pin-like site-specific DNA recombinase
MCEARGWEPVTFRERESGAKERPVWSAVLDVARRGEVRAVVFWSLDRVGRRMFQVLRDVQELARYGCHVVSVREAWLDTGGPTRDLLLSIFGWVAEHERERLRERTCAGLVKTRAKGTKLGRPQVVPGEVVRCVLALRAEGRTYVEIQALLLGAGLGEFHRGSLATAAGRFRLSQKGAEKAGQ